MNIVNTTAPISIEDLKLYFINKETQFLIKYNDSKLKGSKLLTYLSNLDIPADIDFTDCLEEDKLSLLKDYMESITIVSINSLEFLAMQVIEEAKGLFDHGFKSFIDSNTELIDLWLSRIDSLTLYNMHTINSVETKEFVQSFEKADNDDNRGINYVSLLKHFVFYSLYAKIDESKLKYYEKHFNEYMFKGKNLYSYWANDKNTLFLLTYGISTDDKFTEKYLKAKKETLEENINVSSV